MTDFPKRDQRQTFVPRLRAPDPSSAQQSTKNTAKALSVTMSELISICDIALSEPNRDSAISPKRVKPRLAMSAMTQGRPVTMPSERTTGINIKKS